MKFWIKDLLNTFRVIVSKIAEVKIMNVPRSSLNYLINIIDTQYYKSFR